MYSNTSPEVTMLMKKQMAVTDLVPILFQLLKSFHEEVYGEEVQVCLETLLHLSLVVEDNKDLQRGIAQFGGEMSLPYIETLIRLAYRGGGIMYVRGRMLLAR
jgi:hypothetical protein